MHNKFATGVLAAAAVAGPAYSSGAALVAADLYPLTNPGGEVTQVFPTGYHPAAGGVVGGQGLRGDDSARAFLWKSSAAPTDLNPAGFRNSFIYAANPLRQVGFASQTFNGNGHAYVWSGTAASGVDLNPANYTSSVAYAASDTLQYGSISGSLTGLNDHAVIWAGSASSFTDIHPAGFTASRVINFDSSHQIGSASSAQTSGFEHALLWSTGGGVVDLHPSGFTISQGQAVRGGREAGIGYIAAGANPQALLWNGASPQAMNLTPAGFVGSVAYDVSADAVVGYVVTPGAATRAAYWSDSADSFVDLQVLLAPDFVSSQAYTIGADGTIYGTALDATNTYHAVSWTPVPEPALSGLLLVLPFVLPGRRERRAV